MFVHRFLETPNQQLPVNQVNIHTPSDQGLTRKDGLKAAATIFAAASIWAGLLGAIAGENDENGGFTGAMGACAAFGAVSLACFITAKRLPDNTTPRVAGNGTAPPTPASDRSPSTPQIQTIV